MYIRCTSTRSNATGEAYFTYRLVSSERVDGKVKQVTLLNLGRHFAVDAALWPAVCQRVTELMAGQACLLDPALPKAAAREAERIAAQLLAQRAVVYPDAVSVASIATASTSAPPTAALADTETVLVDTLELVRPRSIGVEHVACWAMRQVGFHDLLIECGLSGPLRAAILGVIIGRMAAPDSEAATHRWLGQHSGLGELLDVDFERLPAMTLYRASDALMKHRALIERTLFDRAQALFGFELTVTLYDLTNTYFEGQAETHPKAQHGRSKEKRSDCPLVTLGLVLDGSGFVRRSEVFEGNAAEGKTLAQMLKDLEAPAGALVVMDAGIASEANLTWLREHGYCYLVVSRERARRFEAETAIPIETAAGHSVQIQRVDDPEQQEVRLYCYSEPREHKEQAIDQRFCERFEAGLQKIADGLVKPRGEKRLAKLHERIGRLKEKSHGVSQHYTIELITDPAGENAIELRWNQQIKSGTRLSHPGVYCLRSNQTDWDSEQLWRTYIMLTDLEAVFRSLKSELGLRPVYHHKEERVDGHLFITVLAYQFVQIIRKHLHARGIQSRWSTLREILSVQRRVTASFRRSDGRSLHVRKATRPETELAEIYQALNLNPLPGGTQKTIV
jgi:transposase